MLGPGFAAQCLVRSTSDDDRIPHQLCVLPQGRAVGYHLGRHLEYKPGLIPLGRHAVEFCPRLAVAVQHVDDDARCEHRLTVLPCNHNERFAIPPRTIRPLPPKEVGDDRRFPWLQHERLPSPTPLDVSKCLGKELDRLSRSFLVEPVARISSCERIIPRDAQSDLMQVVA